MNQQSTDSDKVRCKMKIVYKCKDTGYIYQSNDMNAMILKDFNGYRIQTDHGRLSNITEIRNNEVLAKIMYRPTKIPIIEKVEYNGHKQNRYNNNNVSSVYYESHDKLFGEYKKYDTSGNLIYRKYFYDSTDITSDVINFVGYDGNDFINYKFREEERFNLMMKYGFDFRFCDESDIEKLDYTYITEYCQHI